MRVILINNDEYDIKVIVEVPNNMHPKDAFCAWLNTARAATDAPVDSGDGFEWEEFNTLSLYATAG